MKHLIFFLTALFIIIAFPIGAASQIRTYHYTWPKNSVDSLFTDSLDVGVIPYIQLQYEVWIHNPTDDTLSYWQGSSFLGGSSIIYFDSNGVLNALVVPPHDSGKMIAFVDPEGGIGFDDNVLETIGEVTINKSAPPYEAVGTVSLFFAGRVDIRDDELFPLFQNQFWYHSLFFVNLNQEYIPRDSSQYINDQDSIVTIQSLFVPKASHFTISPSLTFPISLKKGETLTVHYLYNEIPDTLGYVMRSFLDSTKFDTLYNDLVVIITDTTYPISKTNFRGYPPKANPKSSVFTKSVLHKEDQILLSANPVIVNTDITVPDARLSKYRIFDLFGNNVAEHPGNHWQWSGISSSGTKLPNGTYTLEAEGISADGKPIHASRNIILMK